MIPRFLLRSFAVLLAVSLGSGCITYYRADPLAGINLARTGQKVQLETMVSRYRATAYFDGSDRTPHTNTTKVPALEFRRDDFIFRVIAPVGRSRVFLVVPVSHVQQRSPDVYHGEPSAWGVEHVWAGLIFQPFTDTRSSILLTAGIPADGAFGNLIGTTGDFNNTPRLSLQYTFMSREVFASPALYLRLGAGLHLGGRTTNGPFVYSQYEGGNPVFDLPGECHVTAPIVSGLAAGGFVDARFVIMDHGNGTGVRSRDAVAVGPIARLALGEGFYLTGNYRHEVIGFLTSAGSSWNVGLSLPVR